jgi:repressor LexA
MANRNAMNGRQVRATLPLPDESSYDDLTPRQTQVLDVISEWILAGRGAPTVREIAAHIGVKSPNAVYDFLTSLERKGYIRRTPGKSRNIELAAMPRAHAVRVPLIGRVAAGRPTLAVEHLEGSFLVDASFVPGGDVFALSISGDSMRNAGIYDGDVVLARLQETAETGDIVVAIVDSDEATVKYFYPDEGRVRLEPANEAFETIVVEDGVPGFRIAGKVVGLLRRV